MKARKTATGFQGEGGGKRGRRSRGRALVGKVLKGALAILLAVALVPAVPFVHEGETAEGLEGTTDYENYFDLSNRFGTVVEFEPFSADKTIRVADTSAQSFGQLVGNDWISSSGLASKKHVSLNHDWEVVLSFYCSPIVSLNTLSFMNSYVAIGLTRNANVGKVTGPAAGIGQQWGSAGTIQNYVAASWMSEGQTQYDYSRVLDTQSWNSSSYLVMRLDASENKLYLNQYNTTYQMQQNLAVRSTSIDNVRGKAGSSAFIFLFGGFNWTYANNPTQYQSFANCAAKITFRSMSLPNLTPEIYDISLYRADGTRIEKDDAVQTGETVQVRCTVRNSNASAMAGGFVEQYPVHLKLANTAQYPTSGLDPFVDSSHPVRVNETTVAASSSADTPTGANGVPVTLAGTTPVTVSYWATVSGEAGDAVMLSQQLIEDSFQGSHYATTKLVNERPLEAAPDGVDPSDPSSGAGTAWHYTRLPKANENGWNVSPVTLTFYPGDYDVMELTPSEGSAATLTAASPAWTRSADTEGCRWRDARRIPRRTRCRCSARAR